MISQKEKLIQLFISTLYLSAFTFGGGYVIVTLMKKKFVDEYHWIEEKEMLDLVAIAQSAPGPIAVNGAIVIGYKLAGLLGVIVSVVATIIPPFVIISLVSLFYHTFKTNVFIAWILEGMQAGVGAVIASVVFDMAYGLFQEKKTIHIMIMFFAFFFQYFMKINIIFIILGCIILGISQYIYQKRRENK